MFGLKVKQIILYRAHVLTEGFVSPLKILRDDLN